MYTAYTADAFTVNSKSEPLIAGSPLILLLNIICIFFRSLLFIH